MVFRRFQHCLGHITTGSWKGRGNQYIHFDRVLYCKLSTRASNYQLSHLMPCRESNPGLTGGRRECYQKTLWIKDMENYKIHIYKDYLNNENTNKSHRGPLATISYTLAQFKSGKYTHPTYLVVLLLSSCLGHINIWISPVQLFAFSLVLSRPWFPIFS